MPSAQPVNNDLASIRMVASFSALEAYSSSGRYRCPLSARCVGAKRMLSPIQKGIALSDLKRHAEIPHDLRKIPDAIKCPESHGSNDWHVRFRQRRPTWNTASPRPGPFCVLDHAASAPRSPPSSVHRHPPRTRRSCRCRIEFQGHSGSGNLARRFAASPHLRLVGLSSTG